MNELRGLWHGKRTDNGEWVEGVPCGKYMICGFNTLRGDDEVTMSEYPEFDYVEIDPSTLGECVGFRDKNRIPMFEGDVVTYKSTTGKTWTGQIFYSVNKSRFVLEVDGGQMFEIARKYANCYEVIGNIYDNPELLKVDFEKYRKDKP